MASALAFGLVRFAEAVWAVPPVRQEPQNTSSRIGFEVVGILLAIAFGSYGLFWFLYVIGLEV